MSLILKDKYFSYKNFLSNHHKSQTSKNPQSTSILNPFNMIFSPAVATFLLSHLHATSNHIEI